MNGEWRLPFLCISDSPFLLAAILFPWLALSHSGHHLSSFTFPQNHPMIVTAGSLLLNFSDCREPRKSLTISHLPLFLGVSRLYWHVVFLTCLVPLETSSNPSAGPSFTFLLSPFSWALLRNFTFFPRRFAECFCFLCFIFSFEITPWAVVDVYI